MLYAVAKIMMLVQRRKMVMVNGKIIVGNVSVFAIEYNVLCMASSRLKAQTIELIK